MIEFLNNHLTLIITIIRLYLLIFLWAYLPIPWGAPWVPTPFATALKMLKMADIKPGELLVDLGAGDGRIVILAAKLYGARAIGVEIDPLRCFFANLVIILLGLRKKAHIYHGNMFSFDITKANIVTLYLLQSTNHHLEKKLTKELQVGARVVSNTFSISAWPLIARDNRRRIFLYEIGKTVSTG